MFYDMIKLWLLIYKFKYLMDLILVSICIWVNIKIEFDNNFKN